MDIRKAIRELYEEKRRLDEVIHSLEELQKTKAVAENAGPRRGRKAMDAAARQEVSRRMKKYWANRRKQG